MFDAENIAADDLADFAGRHVVLSRNCENGGKAFGRKRNDGAGTAFPEEREFGGTVVSQIDIGAEA